MKKYFAGTGLLVLFTSISLNAQTTGSGGGETGAGNSGIPRPPQTQPGLQNPNQLQPGQNPNQLTPGIARGTNNPLTGLAGTNQAGVNATNQFATNNTGQFAGTNAFGAITTNSAGSVPRFGGTNRFFGTNTGAFGAATNQGATMGRDQAFTATDRTILVTVRQRVAPRLRAATGAWAPVNFAVREGVVTI